MLKEENDTLKKKFRPKILKISFLIDKNNITKQIGCSCQISEYAKQYYVTNNVKEMNTC